MSAGAVSECLLGCILIYALTLDTSEASISAYALIAFCRLFVTPHEFKASRWSLGKWGPAFYTISMLYNTFLLTASCTLTLVLSPSDPNVRRRCTRRSRTPSPPRRSTLPSSSPGESVSILDSLYFAHVCNHSGVSIFAIVSWWLVPAASWLRPELIAAMREHATEGARKTNSDEKTAVDKDQ